MRITRLKTLLKASPVMLSMFVVALMSQPAQPVQVQPRNNNVRITCPPPGFNPYATPNKLQNFDMQTAWNGSSTSFIGTGHGGASAAANWSVFNNTQGTTRTWFEGSGVAKFSTDRALVIGTTGARNGITQKWPALGPGPLVATGAATGPLVAMARVKVLTGRVCIGLGNAPNTSCGAATGPTSDYVLIWECAPQASEVTIYSVGGPASFRFMGAIVSKVE